MDWSRTELRTLALWHFAHAWQLDDTDTWAITITPDTTTCDRPPLGNAEAEQIGREMMLRSWGKSDHWRGTITTRRRGDRYDPPSG